MSTFTYALKGLTLDRGARILQPNRAPVARLSADAPALEAMTDLRRTLVVTTTPETLIDNALSLMVHAKVRLLVVTGADGTIAGLVSAQDLMGDKPLRIANDERITHAKVRVAQVMVPTSDIQPLDLRDVEHATVRDVINHLLATKRQHALVIETAMGGGRYMACGIFSATQIGRQLGEDISGSETFAQSLVGGRRFIA